MLVSCRKKYLENMRRMHTCAEARRDYGNNITGKTFRRSSF